MEKVTITVPAQYERMIQKALEIAEHMDIDGEQSVAYRISCMQSNLTHCLDDMISRNKSQEFQHNTLCRSVAHALRSIAQIEKEWKP